MIHLSKGNQDFQHQLKKVLKKWPDASLSLISDLTGYTPGSVSWNLQVLKKGRYVKRDRKGNLIAK